MCNSPSNAHDLNPSCDQTSQHTDQTLLKFSKKLSKNFFFYFIFLRKYKIVYKLDKVQSKYKRSLFPFLSSSLFELWIWKNKQTLSLPLFKLQILVKKSTFSFQILHFFLKIRSGSWLTFHISTSFDSKKLLLIQRLKWVFFVSFYKPKKALDLHCYDGLFNEELSPLWSVEFEWDYSWLKIQWGFWVLSIPCIRTT